MTKQERKKTKTPCEITPFFTLIFRLFAWRLFVILSFRLALFRLFVISRGVFSLFCPFAWRYFVLAPLYNARRKDERTKWHKQATIVSSMFACKERKKIYKPMGGDANRQTLLQQISSACSATLRTTNIADQSACPCRLDWVSAKSHLF